MISLLLIFLFCTLIILWGVRNAFLLYFLLYIVGCQFPVPGLPGSVSLQSVLIILFYISNCKNINRYYKRIKYYPFVVGSIASVCSYVLSSFLTKGDPHWGMTYMKCVDCFLMPLLFFYYIDQEMEIKKVLLLLNLVVCATIFLCVVDIALNQSVWNNLMTSLIGRDYGWNRIEEVRFGLHRLQAFFLQPVSFGYFCVTMFSFYLLFFFGKRKSGYYSNFQLLFFMGCTVVGCFLSASRTALLPLFLLLIFYCRDKLHKPIYWFIFALVAFFISYFGYNYLSEIYQSIVNSDDAGMGSTTDSREIQWTITITYWKLSPIWGHGTYALFDYVKDTMDERSMMGGESIWFSLLINYGIVGAITYIVLYVESFLVLRNSYFIPILVFLFIQLLLHTMTSTPGFDIGFMMCFVILIYKIKERIPTLLSPSC